MKIKKLDLWNAISIDDILQGKTFYSNKKKRTKYGKVDIGVAVALQEALDFTGKSGYIATMPELIAAKVKADKSHDLWKKEYTAYTEENIGIDSKGRFYTANKPVLVVVHGGGILTPKRIMKSYKDLAPEKMMVEIVESMKLGDYDYVVDDSVRYDSKKFNNLLDGKLYGGESLTLYRIEEIIDGVSNLPHKFGVVMPYKDAQNTVSDFHTKKDFMENPLVIARAGGLEHLEAYFEKAKCSKIVLYSERAEKLVEYSNQVGNWHKWHKYSGKNLLTPRSCILFLGSSYRGLDGDEYLSSIGNFLGVMPKAHKSIK